MPPTLSLNPTLANLPVYQPGRPIEEVARELGLPATDFIKLASNENPLGPSPKALAAIQAAAASVHLYPDGNAFYFKRRLAEKLNVEPANLILGNGSNEIIEFIGHALMAPGTDVVVFHVLDPHELEFPFERATRFQDMETDAEVLAVPAQVREHYTAAMGALIDRYRRELGGAGIDYTLLTTAEPLEIGLMQYLSKREHTS